MKFKIETCLSMSNKKSDVHLVITSNQHSQIINKYNLSKLQAAQIKEENSKIILRDKILYVINLGETKVIKAHHETLNESLYAQSREKVGSLITDIVKNSLTGVEISFLGLDDIQIEGSIVGMELGLYRFKKSLNLKISKIFKEEKLLSKKTLTKASNIGVAINQARHLVNLPPNELNPVNYANEVKKMYEKSKTIKVTIINEKELKKQKCGLLLCVGNSSGSPARIVKIQYNINKKSKEIISLVGKGITFDTGGVDLKPAAGMRLMKKDMGGSATLVGLSRWLEESGVDKNIEIFLALAENSISQTSARPGDIYTSRSGHEVEIHNTDAEGRLALADAISIALDSKPSTLIDVATLTGAGKVALGQDIASLFSNNDKLASDLIQSGTKMGDLSWRMPLYTPYENDFKSDFSDMTNAGSSGYAGSITAALFLQKFIPANVKWAHLDIFAWTSGAKPSLVQKGGSGQSVETLIEFLN